MALAKKISIVIPVYREGGNLTVLHSRLECVTRSIPSIAWDYIFVNDGSPDDSLEVLTQLAASDEKCRIIDLSRNFGKEIALTAGVHEVVDADAVICMDADLQHPPEVIPEFVRHWESGAEIVVTVRRAIKKQPLLRRVGSHCYYWLMSKISGLDMVSQTTDFRLYDIKVIRAFARATERERMFRGIMDWMGFRRSYVEFEADARNDGEAGYSYKKLIKLAVGSIMSFSLWPLKLTGYLGLAITSVSSVLLLWMISNYLLHTQWVYTPLAMVVVANTFLIGIVLMAIGLVALYVGSIHTEVINRPMYVIRDRINFDSHAGRNAPR